ncbi:MAG: glycosyltransferase family 39 protein [Thermodesulfobacteriota bacterium]
MKPKDKPVLESFWRTIWRDSRVRAVLALGIIVRLLILGYLTVHPAGIFAKGDSKDYLQLAQNLLYYQSFGRAEISPKAIQKPVVRPRDEGERASLIPETFRTPVYPAFLTVVYGVSGSPVVAVTVQSLISLLTVWLIILLMARLFRSSAAWLAGLLAALDPLSLTYTHQLMTESLFLCFMVLGVYVFLTLMITDGQGKSSLAWPVLGGLALGLAALTRPVGIYFPLFLLGLWMVGVFLGVWQKLRDRTVRAGIEPGSPVIRRFGAASKAVIIFVAVSFLPLALWSVRNHHHYNRFIVSTCADHNLLVTITAHMVAKIRNPEGNISSWQIFEEIEQQLEAQMASQGFKNPTEPEKADYFRTWSLQVIKSQPMLFLQYYFKGMVILFIPDVAGFFELFGFTQEGKGALGAVFRQGLQAALTRYFGEHWPFWVAAALPLIIFELGVYGLAVIGIAALWRSRDFYLLFILLAIIGYWLALAAIGAAPRYRAPVMPFLDLLAAWGLFTFGSRSWVGSR